ncbi:MAG: ferredoxin [Verrucomicrobiota bacterium]
MADRDDRHSDNVPGRFYTDEECICCSICSELAPDFFKQSEIGGHNIVYRQPSSDREVDLAHSAIHECPVQAIGSDGLDESS